MKLTFLARAHEVTGSCTLVEAAGHRFLVDCGMEQGRNTYENEDLPCAPGEIEAVLLTHAHIDHSGRLPYLYKNGYRGPIYATDATTDLCDIMLEDSAHIQEQEAEWKNRKAQRSGREPVEPDYTVQDALAVMEQFRPQPYGKPVAVLPGVQATFTDVGHLLGSSSITLRITEEGRTETIVFSGDIGNSNQPMLRDPQYLTEADYVVMESTYGNRSHGPSPTMWASWPPCCSAPSTGAAMWSSPALRWAAPRRCCISSARSRPKTGSGATAISRSMWTARWPANPPPSSGKTTANALTRKPSTWCAAARTRCPSRAAHQRDQGGLGGHQRRPQPQGDPVGLRHVRRRAHPPPPQAQPLAGGMHHPLCGLPGRRLAGPHPAGRRRPGQALRRGGAGQRRDRPDVRHVRPRGPRRL